MNFASKIYLYLNLISAYTNAINTGKMPNIQNAWSYVCQNECQRAINDAIASYDSQMRKILEKAKEQCNEDLIRKEKSLLKEQAVSAFKSKAVG